MKVKKKKKDLKKIRRYFFKKTCRIFCLKEMGCLRWEGFLVTDIKSSICPAEVEHGRSWRTPSPMQDVRVVHAGGVVVCC